MSSDNVNPTTQFVGVYVCSYIHISYICLYVYYYIENNIYIYMQSAKKNIYLNMQDEAAF